MHIVFDLIPLDVEAGAVSAENRVGGIFEIRFGIIICRGDDGLGIVAGGVATERDLQPALTLRIGGHHIGIVSQLRCRNLSF